MRQRANWIKRRAVKQKGIYYQSNVTDRKYDNERRQK